MKKKSIAIAISVVAVTAYATGFNKDWKPVSNRHTIKLSESGKEYAVSGIGQSRLTKAAIINRNVVSQGMEIEDGVVLNDVQMDSPNISAENVKVTITL